MKRTPGIFALFLSGLLALPLARAKGENTDGTVTFTVTTSTYSGSYAPKHVAAVWVVDGSGKFVKTLCRHAATRMNYLSKWISDRGSYMAVDGVTSATLSSQPQTHTVTWNCRGTHGLVAADGTYTFRAEYTSNNGQGPYMGSQCAFTKGSAAVTQNYANYSNGGGQFSGLTLTYKPYNEVAVTALSPASGSAGSTVPVTVTVTNQTLNTLSFSVAVSNVTSGALIGTLPVASLPGKATTNLTYSWNTTGLGAAAYQVAAVASKLATETNVANNVLSGTITLTSASVGDIALAALAPAAANVGDSVPVQVTVTNKTANPSGSFSVSLQAPVAGQQTTSLAAYSAATLSFTWNTAGATAGVYQVRAQAGPLAGETYTNDNVLAGLITLSSVTHDVAVKSILLTPLVPPGVTTNVLVVVTNLGGAAETVVAALRDVTGSPILIGTRTVTNLASGAGMPVTFSWNTATNAGFQVGRHTLQADLTPVSGETALSNNTSTAEVIVASGLATRTLVAKNALWRYLDKGLDISGAPWLSADYYDGFWASGPAPLGYGLLPIATTVGYGGVPSQRYTTTYFRQAFTVDSAPLSVTGLVMRAHGVVLYLNGTEIFRYNLPEGAVGYSTLASHAILGWSATNYFGFAVDPAKLVVGRNILSAELHLSSAADTTAGFGLQLSATAPSIPAVSRVSPVSITPEGSAQWGDAYGLFVELVNSGNTTASCLLLLRDAATGEVVASQTVGALTPGEATSVKVTWPTLNGAAGSHTLQALTVVNGVTNLANVATASVTVDALDFSPRKVAAAGSIGGRCSAVAVSGHSVFLGCGATLEVWDAATPSAPERIGALRLPGIVEDLAVSGSWVYAAAGSAGVQIVDVSTPAKPRHVATFDTADFARRVTVSGSLLYVADCLGGVRVLNVATPASPVLAGALYTAGPAQCVLANPPNVLVLDGQQGLRILSGASPGAMTSVGSQGLLTAGLSLAALANNAWVSDANGKIFRVSLSTPAAPSVATNALLSSAARELAVSGSALYVADGPNGLLTLDAATLALQSATEVGDEAYDVAVSGTTLYVAAGFAGCRSLNISKPFAPTPLATYETGGRPVDAALAGSALLVAADEGGLQVHGLDSLALPTLLGTVSSVSNSRCVEVSYPLAFVGDGLFGLKVFNVSNAAAPKLVGTYPAPGLSHVRRVAASGSRVVLTDGRLIQLVSVESPASPALLATVTNVPGSFVFDIAAVGLEAYAACGNAGVRIYGLDNNLKLDSAYATPGPATGVAYASNLLHVACGPYGWQTLSLEANPLSPALVKSSVSEPVFQVAASGAQLYLSDGSRSAWALKNGGASSSAVTNFANLTQALRVKGMRGLMLVAEDEAGLSILQPEWVSDASAGQGAIAGMAFEMALPDAFAFAARVTVKGLPAGLRYNATTRLITGVPTKSGTFVVTISAPGVATQTITLSVEALPAWAWGSFSGFTDGGRVASMSVSAQGKVSGKLVVNGTNYTFTATSFAAGGSARDGFLVSTVAKAGRTTFPLKLLVSHPSGAAAASLGVADGLFNEALRLLLYRNVWKEEKSLLAPYVGYYTASLPGGSGYGSAYLTLTVDAAGKVKTAGKLADGTGLSLSGPLLLDGSGRVFVVIYGAPTGYKGGFLFGLAEFVKPAAGRVFLRLLDDALFVWQSRNPLATSVYGEGFARQTGLVGGWYDKIGNLYDYYRDAVLTAGSDAGAPAPELTVQGVRVASALWRPDGAALTVVANASGVMTGLQGPPKSAASGDDDDDDESERTVELTISLTRATGIFKSAFKTWFDVGEKSTYKAVSCLGVLTPERENKADGVAGRGYFLWPDSAQYTTSGGQTKTYGFNGSYDFKILLSNP